MFVISLLEFVLRSINFVITPPAVSSPRLNGVTSSKSKSLIFSLNYQEQQLEPAP